MREKAIVVANKGEKSKVEITRTSACDHCRACPVGTDDRSIQVWADNPLKAKVGQKVEIEMETRTLLSATFIAYGIPLIAFLLGISLGYKGALLVSEDFREVFSLLVGLGTMVIGFLGVHLYSRKASNREKYTSRIVNVLE